MSTAFKGRQRLGEDLQVFSRPLVLIVDDEPSLITLLRYTLERRGFRVGEAVDGQDALAKISAMRPDLVLLDWTLPLLSGIEVCRHLRREHATRDLPVIMMTARSGDRDAIIGFENGADGYLVKPLNMNELVARIYSVLRRAKRSPERDIAEFRDLIVDFTAHRVRRNGRFIQLGPTEFRLIGVMTRYPRRVFSRTELLDIVWGRDIHVEPRTVDVHVRRLRDALNAQGEVDLVRTVRGSGYTFDDGY